MENDEVYIPRTRGDLNIPDEHPNETINYEEIFSDTPIYTLFMLLRQQLFAFPAYLCKHSSTNQIVCSDLNCL